MGSISVGGSRLSALGSWVCVGGWCGSVLRAYGRTGHYLPQENWGHAKTGVCGVVWCGVGAVRCESWRVEATRATFEGESAGAQ